jgi:adenosylcobinamide-GDP ribazoletransferase
LFTIPLGLAINAAIAAFAAILFWRWLAKKQIGGQTGDVLGALGQTVEITVLIVIASSV